MSESNGKSADTDAPRAAGQGQQDGEHAPDAPEQGEQAQGAQSSAEGTEAAAEPSGEELLAQVTAERDRLKDQLLRTAAEYDNFRKRSKRDVDEADRRGREEVLREVLPVIDNLERAASAASDAQDASAVAEGVQMVLRQFQDVASRIQLERIEAVGQRFDPNIHDAIQQQQTDEVAPGTIVAEVTPGYRFGDRLLRAAVVVVARPPSGGAQDPSAQADGEGSGASDGSSSDPSGS